jgi:hypothetical protein
MSQRQLQGKEITTAAHQEKYSCSNHPSAAKIYGRPLLPIRASPIVHKTHSQF